MWGKRANTQLSSGVYTMHVGGSGPAQQMPFRPKGKSVSPDSAAATTVRSGEMEAPDPGPERRAAEKVGKSRGLQRSGEIREGGYSEDRAQPWAAHTHAHINTPEKHTQGCQNIHIRRKSTSLTHKPEGRS